MSTPIKLRSDLTRDLKIENMREFKKNNETKAHNQLAAAGKQVAHRIIRIQNCC